MKPIATPFGNEPSLGRWRGCVPALLALSLSLSLVLPGRLAAQFTGTALGQAEYQNRICTPGPTPVPEGQELAVTLTAAGHQSADASAAPNDGQYRLLTSRIGQPIEGSVLMPPDFYLGEEFTITLCDYLHGNDVDLRQEPDADDSSKVFFVYDSGGYRGFASGAGFVTITWKKADGSLALVETYLISSELPPQTKPVRLYWTRDGDHSTGAPEVDFSGLSVIAHYNNVILRPDHSGRSKTLHISDSTKTISANGGAGLIILELRNHAGFVGIQAVDVRPYSADFVTQVDIGEFLAPNEPAFATEAPVVARGLERVTTPKVVEPYAVQLNLPEGASHHGSVFAVRPTPVGVGVTPPIQVIWQQRGALDLLWHAELHHYTAKWPANVDQLSGRIYHTHDRDGSSTLSPPIQLKEISGVRIHYNDTIPAPPPGIVDPATNGETYLWLDVTSKRLHAKRKTGSILLHYLDERGHFLGVQHVSIHNYDADLVSNDWPVGTRLLPSAPNRTDPGVPLVTKGLEEPSLVGPPYVHVHQGTGPQQGHIFAVRPRKNGDRPPIEVFWQRPGLENVMWPYELHRYWPVWPGLEEQQLFVRGHNNAQLGVSVQLPAAGGFSAVVMPFQDPDGHAHIHAQEFYTYAVDNGLSLLKFETDLFGETAVYFQVVRSVRHNTGSVSTVNWDIGHEISDPHHEYAPEHPKNRGYLFVDRDKAASSDREDRYAPAIYADTGQIFGVNEGTLEVWWYNTTSYGGFPVQWPSLVRRYNLVWPESPEKIIIASEQGSAWTPSGIIDRKQLTDPSIYYQNDKSLPGFNPNDEHAFIAPVGIGDAVHALRNDLGTPQTSEPYVLLQFKRAVNNLWGFHVFAVVAEEDPYYLNYPTRAGLGIRAPNPLGLLDMKTNDFVGVSGPFWIDRKNRYHVRSAGDDDGPAEIKMHYTYPVQEGFFFPGASPPVQGDSVPWLDLYAGTPGTPVTVTWTAHWPDRIPDELHDRVSPVAVARLAVGQTAMNQTPGTGLPIINVGNGVEIIYHQSVINGIPGGSVKLIDPTYEHSVPLAQLPADIVKTDPPGNVYFPDLPPQLRARLWYDPLNKRLRFKGTVVDSIPVEYLLLNVLSEREQVLVKALSADAAWQTAVNNLIQLSADVITVPPDSEGYDSLALTAGLAKGVGYVTLAMGNNENLADPGDPVVLHVIRVDCPIHRGDIEVIESQNPFDEKLTLRHSGDFAGRADDYEFQWRYHPPENGFPSSKPRNEWFTFTPLPHPLTGNPADGAVDITIEGANILTLSDNWFVCRYRPKSRPVCSSSTNPDDWWSDWTDPMLAEGWIKRVLAKINPFEQRIKDYANTEINTIVSMISQAGPRASGAIPLDSTAAEKFGLIEIYETVMNRGVDLSIGGGLRYGPANDALLLVAGRLADLYTLLGNEAYADAADPTIAFGTSDGQYGNEASSIFCFMNQVPSLLEEELALLRGRDDRMLPSVRTYPVYNRLVWNFTRDITGGEVAYALNYNIRNQDGSVDGSIDSEDARILYPQGHGDAWGHYLTALKYYYRLLRHPNFDWVPRIEAVLVGGVPVSVDYLDERKFAQVASARARTGAEIANLAYRQRYLEDPTKRFHGYADDDPVRAWGLSEWGSRAGQGAYLDWAMANALLPTSYRGSYRVTDHTLADVAAQGATHVVMDSLELLLGKLYSSRAGLEAAVRAVLSEDDFTLYGPVLLGSPNLLVPNPNPGEGIQTIDRTTVLELQQLPAHFSTIQAQVDQADTGLNPLGLANNVVPFDISPAELDNGITHFEQVYHRAVGTMNNAIAVFNHAVNSSQLLRRQADEVERFTQNVKDREFDFEGRLIEIFGTPYNGDMGPTGSYPSGYQGPDLVNWDLIERSELEGELRPANQDVPFQFSHITVDARGGLSTTNHNVTFRISDDAWEKRKPDNWGRRRVTGELQRNLFDLVQARVRLQKGLHDYDGLISHIEDQAALLEAQYNLNLAEVDIMQQGKKVQETLNQNIARSRARQLHLRTGARMASIIANAYAESIPTSVGMAPDVLAPLRGKIRLAGALVGELTSVAADFESLAELDHQQAKESAQLKDGIRLTTLRTEFGLLQQLAQIEQLLRQEASMRLELYALRDAITQTAAGYLSALARGERLLTERSRFRQQTATEVQQYRYKDMAFRIFRNDALQKYRAQFDLAARFVFLAARAYDYETALKSFCVDPTDPMNPEPVENSLWDQFMTGIIRSRSLGTITGGFPQTGAGDGDPGLADPLARLERNFTTVLKPQLNINNPSVETDRFSLRYELFRILPGSGGSERWREVLERHMVANLNDVPEFKRYCIKPSPFQAIEPGFVIPFSTTINFGQNFFGWPAGGGDNSYDSSRFATKIRSVGVWFANYNSLIGSGMINTPNVYLIPVGNDVLRSPSCDNGDIRTWKILDQALPLPFPLTSSDLNTANWLPIDGLNEDFINIRKYASFRAYHDSGWFNPAEATKDSRLVGRSVWNTRWLLIIPAGTLNSDRQEGIAQFIHGPKLASGLRTGTGVTDIKLFFQTYSYAGNVPQ